MIMMVGSCNDDGVAMMMVGICYDDSSGLLG